MAKPAQNDPSKNDPPKPEEPTQPDAAKPLTEEERIAKQRANALEENAGKAATKLAEAEARANSLEGELKAVKAEFAASQAQVVELTKALAKAATEAANAGGTIDDLPRGARQVNESVTIQAVPRGGDSSSKPRRAEAKKGDVLLVCKSDDEVDALQRELGLRATVHRVRSEQVQDLERAGFLHA